MANGGGAVFPGLGIDAAQQRMLEKRRRKAAPPGSARSPESAVTMEAQPGLSSPEVLDHKLRTSQSGPRSECVCAWVCVGLWAQEAAVPVFQAPLFAPTFG